MYARGLGDEITLPVVSDVSKQLSLAITSGSSRYILVP